MMKGHSHKHKRHELLLFVMNGTIYPTTAERFRTIVFSRPYISFSLLFLAAMLIGEVAIYGYNGGTMFLAIFWLLALIVFIVIWYWQFVLVSIFKPTWAPKAIPTVVLHIMPLLLMSTVTKAFSDYWIGEFSGFEIPEFLYVFRLLLLTVAFEFMVTKWVLPFVPGTQAANARKKSGNGAIGDKQILFGNTTYFLSDVLYLRSAEHYVELVTTGSSCLYRAKLGEIIEQFDDDDGIQTHRSYWVPCWSVDALICKKKKKVMVLKNGIEIPVSRSRQDTVANWVEKNIPVQKRPDIVPGLVTKEA